MHLLQLHTLNEQLLLEPIFNIEWIFCSRGFWLTVETDKNNILLTKYVRARNAVLLEMLLDLTLSERFFYISKSENTNHSAIRLCSFEYVQNMHFFENTGKTWQWVQILDIFCTGRNHTISNIFEDLSVDLAQCEFHFNSFTLPKLFEWEKGQRQLRLDFGYSYRVRSHESEQLFWAQDE